MRIAGLVLVVLAAAALGGAASSGAAAGAETFTIYSTPTRAQFMNHADDRLRGMTINPFNVKTKTLVIVTKGKEKGNGPFPGDDVLYSFNLFSGSKLNQRAGAAMFTCYYDFLKHAICDAYFELKDGLLLASGSVGFTTKRFTLSVTGGTGKYFGRGGQVSAHSAAQNAERFDVRLTR
jgi:ABC-type glycerol-3-phosphate transport system substrate-binding protein